MMDQIKEAAQKLKEKVSNNPLEKLLNEATADVNWNASNKILQEIADHTYSFGDFTEVMKFIWKKLGSERKGWRKILKTLTLIEYLVKNGSPRCVQEFKGEIYLIRTLQDFSHYEDGQDRGAAIRDVSKRVVQLLNDDSKIDEERKKAQEIRERLGPLAATGSTGGKAGSSYSGFSSSDARKGGGSTYNSGTTSGEGVRKTKDWRVDKTEDASSKNRDTEKEETYVTKTGTKYETESRNEREKEEEPAVKPNTQSKKLAPPKGLKAPVQQQHQQEVNLFEMDAPASQPTETTKSSAPVNNNNAGFDWDTPQTQQKTDNSFNWDQGQPQANVQSAQPTASNQFNWNQAPTNQPTQPTNNVQNLYQQQSQPQPQPQATNQFAFNFNSAPQNNMNNLTSQLNQLNFNNAPAPTTNFNMPGTFSNQQSTQQAQPTNMTNLLTSSPPAKAADGFDDFQTAKNTSSTHDYKNYSQQEKSIIDLSDLGNEAAKKQTQKEKIETSKNSNEGFLYSSKDELDNFFVPPQPLNNLTNMNMYQAPNNMGGGFNPGMMNQGMRNMGGMQQMTGMQMGMNNNMPQMGMGMQGMPQMGMGMNMGYQNMGGNQNPGFNPMMGNMQGGFGNPAMNQMNQMGGFGYR